MYIYCKIQHTYSHSYRQPFWHRYTHILTFIQAAILAQIQFLLAPLTESHLSGADGIIGLSVIIVQSSVNFLNCYSSSSCYSIILIFFTRETRHLVPPCNKVGMLNFHLEFQISLKRYSSLSSYSIILNSFTKLGIL